MDSVEKLFEDFKSAYDLLMGAGEISAATFLGDEFRKVFLIACASQFESEVCRILNEACHAASGGKQWLCKLVESKVTARNYHSLFSWDQLNVNSFFGMLGDELAGRAKALAKSSTVYSDGVRAFLEIGSDRNRLVHGNYSTFTLEKTPEEIRERFRTGMAFVDQLRIFLTVETEPATEA